MKSFKRLSTIFGYYVDQDEQLQGFTDEDMQAIAALPELIEALQATMQTLDAYYDGRPETSRCASWFKGKVALAKATANNGICGISSVLPKV